MNNLDSELVNVRQNRDELASNLANASEALQDSKVELDGLRNIKDSFKKRIEELSTQFSSLSHARDTLEQELSKQLDLKTVANASMAVLTSKINGLETEKAELHDQLRRISEVNEKHIAEVGHLKCKLEDLRSEIQIIAYEREMIQADLDQKNSVIEDLEKKLNESRIVTQKMSTERKAIDEMLADHEFDVQQLRSSESSLLKKLETATLEITTLLEDKDEIACKLSKETQELKMTKDELIRAHDIVESSNARLGEMKQKVIDLEDELESKISMLSHSQEALQRERENLSFELLEAQRSCQKLQNELDAFKSGEAKNTIDLTKFSDLENENMQLKQLLASANVSVDDARATANFARLDLERKEKEVTEAYDRISQLEMEMDTAYTKISAVHSPDQYEANIRIILDEKRQLADLLEKERANWKESEAILRRQMSEEQRALIREAEHTMQSLRSELSRSQQQMKNLETEAYLTRQMKEELAEKSKFFMQRIDQLEKNVTLLENENLQLKQTTNTLQHDAEKEAQITFLLSSLDKIKLDNATKRSTIIELEQMIEKLQVEKNEFEKKLSKIKIKDYQLENTRMKHEIKNLEEEIEKLRDSELASVSKLNATIRKLTQQNDVKDERIKKLQKSKITKEQAAAIKKLKHDYDTCMKELQSLREKNSNLRAELSSESEKMEDSEVTSLRFDKEALERKLRKFAAHCQRLEDEKVRIMQSLRSTGLCETGNSSEPFDIEKSIVALCDRLASVEEECASLSKSERRASTIIAETEELRAQNSALLKQISETQNQIEKLRQSYDKHDELVKSLQRENEILRRKTEQNRELESNDSEQFNKLRYLEHENLQLMNDLKVAKKQLQNTKAELSVLRTQHLNEEFDVSSAQKTVVPSSKKRAKCTPKPSKTQHNKENLSSNIQNPNFSQKADGTIGSKKRRTPGLGEAFAASEENTQECKNS
jgi:chromosome segregation ATPase